MRFIIIAALFLLSTTTAFAAESYVVTELAEVIAITEEREGVVPGTDVSATYQTLRAKILEGVNEGSIVTVENDYLTLKVGDKFYAEHRVDPTVSLDRYTVVEPYRLPGIATLLVLFVLCAWLVGGKQGVRGLVALAVSFAFISYLLLPGILAGINALFVAFGVASLIIILGSYITHGFNRVTTAAVIGMVATIGITALLAALAIEITHLSGFTSEEAVYLNLDTEGAIDFKGLLLGAMLIAILGVLYDAAIGQAVAVDELTQSAPRSSRTEVFKRAMRIGKEHIGALVNTLAIAYVGVALPLLLLFSSLNSDASLLTTLNREVFAEEIVRMAVGAIGIMLTVPVTTGVAVWTLIRPEQV